MKVVVRILAALFALAAVGVACIGVSIVFSEESQQPVLVRVSSVAQQQVESLFTLLEQGAYPAAQKMLLGNPKLGIDRSAKDGIPSQVWDAYQSSLHFEPLGDFYATDEGMDIAYKVTKLHLPSVLEGVPARAEAIMKERVAQAERMEDIYDSNNQYKEELLQEVVALAVDMALQEDAVYTESEFVVHLAYQDGTWQILGDESLVAAIVPTFAD